MDVDLEVCETQNLAAKKNKKKTLGRNKKLLNTYRNCKKFSLGNPTPINRL